MKNIAISLFCLFCCVFCSYAQNDTLSLRYDSPDYDNTFLKNLMELQEINQKKVTVAGSDMKNKNFVLRSHHVIAGSDSISQMVPFPLPMIGDSSAIYFGVRPVNVDSIYVVIDGPFSTRFGIRVNTENHILMETYGSLPFSVADTIPLIAYSTGIVKELSYKGQVVKNINYCQLRDARLHPSKWYEKYGIDDFIYYDIIFLPRKD